MRGYTAWISAALMLAYIACVATTIVFYRIDWVYRAGVIGNRALTVASLVAGCIMLIRESRRGHWRRALWPSALVLLTGGTLALLALGELLVPNSN